MIFDGFYLQQLKVGIQFSSQRSRPGCTVKASNPSHQTSGQLQDPDPWLWRKEFSQRQKVVKQVKYLLEEKNTVCVWLDTQPDL